MVFCACGSLMEFGHILRERVLDTMTNLHQQWLAPHRKPPGDKQGCAYKPPCGMLATLLYRGMHLRWKMIIVRILTGLRFSFGFSLNISMNSISTISTICIQLITQYQHHAQRFLAKGMVYRHGANVCWTALDGSCLGWASGTCSRKNCWDKLHKWLEAWELTPQGVFFCFFLSHVKSVIHCFDKNGVKTPVQMGGTLVVSHCGSTLYIWLYDTPNGVYRRSLVYRLMRSGGRQPRLREMGHGGYNSFSQGMAKLHQQAEGIECVRGFYSVFV